MKRAGRIFYRMLTALSLLLLLATAGVWARSYWVSDLLNWYDWPPDRSFFDNQTIWCSRGGLGLLAQHYLTGSIHSLGDVHFLHDRFPGTLYDLPHEKRTRLGSDIFNSVSLQTLRG